MFLVHDVARLLRVDADKRASVHGDDPGQWGILIWLERQPGLSQKELAELLEVEPITVARLIDRLELAGWSNDGPTRRTAASGACTLRTRLSRAARNRPPARRDAALVPTAWTKRQ